MNDLNYVNSIPGVAQQLPNFKMPSEKILEASGLSTLVPGQCLRELDASYTALLRLYLVTAQGYEKLNQASIWKMCKKRLQDSVIIGPSLSLAIGAIYKLAQPAFNMRQISVQQQIVISTYIIATSSLCQLVGHLA